MLALMAQTHSAGPIAEIASTFGVTWNLLIAQVMSFAVVCGLLYWLAYEPILRMLDERRRQIALGLANAAEIQAKLASIEAQRQGIIAKARAEGDGIAEQARHVARRFEQEQKQLAAAAAAEIVRKAHDATALERTRMMAELTREVGRLVVQTTGVVIGTVLTPGDQRRLAEETSRHLRQSAAPEGAA
jgi:F-type H+-transporting ATPase subunit b